LALKAHLRSPDQPKTKIDVVYGDAKGNLRGLRASSSLHHFVGTLGRPAG